MKKMKYCTNCGVQLLDKNNQPAFELYDEELHKKSNILKVMSCQNAGKSQTSILNVIVFYS